MRLSDLKIIDDLDKTITELELAGQILEGAEKKWIENLNITDLCFKLDIEDEESIENFREELVIVLERAQNGLIDDLEKVMQIYKEQEPVFEYTMSHSSSVSGKNYGREKVESVWSKTTKGIERIEERTADAKGRVRRERWHLRPTILNNKNDPVSQIVLFFGSSVYLMAYNLIEPTELLHDHSLVLRYLKNYKGQHENIFKKYKDMVDRTPGQQ